MKRKGAGPNAEAGARARTGSAAEIHGSGSKTGEAVKDPERAAGSKPGREKGSRRWVACFFLRCFPFFHLPGEFQVFCLNKAVLSFRR